MQKNVSSEGILTEAQMNGMIKYKQMDEKGGAAWTI